MKRITIQYHSLSQAFPTIVSKTQLSESLHRVLTMMAKDLHRASLERRKRSWR